MAENMNRDQLVERIEATKREMKSAGPVHYRDLRKHLKRMTAQLSHFDRYRASAQREAG